MPRPRRRKLRAGDQVRYTIPTPELAAYLERWGPGGISQAITAGLMLLMYTGREPGRVPPSAPEVPVAPAVPAQGAPEGREAEQNPKTLLAPGPSSSLSPTTGPAGQDAAEQKSNPPGRQDSVVRRLALSAFDFD